MERPFRVSLGGGVVGVRRAYYETPDDVGVVGTGRASTAAILRVQQDEEMIVGSGSFVMGKDPSLTKEGLEKLVEEALQLQDAGEFEKANGILEEVEQGKNILEMRQKQLEAQQRQEELKRQQQRLEQQKKQHQEQKQREELEFEFQRQQLEEQHQNRAHSRFSTGSGFTNKDPSYMRPKKMRAPPATDPISRKQTRRTLEQQERASARLATPKSASQTKKTEPPPPPLPQQLKLPTYRTPILSQNSFVAADSPQSGTKLRRASFVLDQVHDEQQSQPSSSPPHENTNGANASSFEEEEEEEAEEFESLSDNEDDRNFDRRRFGDEGDDDISVSQLEEALRSESQQLQQFELPPPFGAKPPEQNSAVFILGDSREQEQRNSNAFILGDPNEQQQHTFASNEIKEDDDVPIAIARDANDNAYASATSLVFPSQAGRGEEKRDERGTLRQHYEDAEWTGGGAFLLLAGTMQPIEPSAKSKEDETDDAGLGSELKTFSLLRGESSAALQGSPRREALKARSMRNLVKEATEIPKYREKKGYLIKAPSAKRALFGAHRKRWFILAGSVLVYCKSEKSDTARGMIPIANAGVIGQLVPEHMNPTEFEIVLQVPEKEDRTWHLFAPSREECIDWVAAIDNNIKVKRLELEESEKRVRKQALLARAAKTQASRPRADSKVGFDIAATPEELEETKIGEFYKLLGVAPTSDADTIKRKYHALARSLHPDKNPNVSAEQFSAIGRAFQTLKDPQTRAEYDLCERIKRAFRLGILVTIHEEEGEEWAAAMFLSKDFTELYWQPEEYGSILTSGYHFVEMRFVQQILAGDDGFKCPEGRAPFCLSLLGKKLGYPYIRIELE